MRQIWLFLIAILLSAPASAATITQGFSATAPIERDIAFVVSFDPSLLLNPSQRTEISLDLIPFTLRKFDPAQGELTSVEVTYRARVPGPRGQNSVVGANNQSCGRLGDCEKRLDIEATFTYGIAIEGVSGSKAGFVDGLGFDIAVVSGAKGTSAPSVQVPAISDLVDGQSSTRQFTGGLMAPFIGDGPLMINALNAVAVRLDLFCTPLSNAPLEACSQSAQVFMKPAFEVDVAYTFAPNAPVPSTIPLPSSLPLLAATLVIGAGLSRRHRC